MELDGSNNLKEQSDFSFVENLSETERGTGGFGSTGLKS